MNLKTSGTYGRSYCPVFVSSGPKIEFNQHRGRHFQMFLTVCNSQHRGLKHVILHCRPQKNYQRVGKKQKYTLSNSYVIAWTRNQPRERHFQMFPTVCSTHGPAVRRGLKTHGRIPKKSLRQFSNSATFIDKYGKPNGRASKHLITEWPSLAGCRGHLTAHDYQIEHCQCFFFEVSTYA